MNDPVSLRFPCRLFGALFLAGLLIGSWAAPTLRAQRGNTGRPATNAPQASPGIGLELKEQPGRGGPRVEVVAVIPHSPAAAAGFQPGDVLLKLMSQPVKSSAQVSTSVQAWLATSASAAGRPLQFVVQRGRSEVKLQVILASSGAGAASTNIDRSARVRARRGAVAGTGASLAVGTVTDPFALPGVAARATDGATLNVLQRVFLDPSTGELVFVGHYDPAYATGTIDYATLLSDALRSPTPSFSLEPTAASRAASSAFVQQFDRQMATNLSSVEKGKAWMTGWFDQLLNNPALEVDRRRFLARGAAIFGVKPAEVPAFVQSILGRTAMGSPPWVDCWARIYQHLGAPAAANYIRAAANKDNDPAAFQASLDGLGVRPVIEDLRARMQSGQLSQPVVYARLEVAIWAAIYERTGVPASRWRAIGDRAGATGDMTQFRANVDAINAEMVTDKVLNVWLNGLVLSETFLQVMQQMPPLEVEPVCSDGLAPDSELARTFLAADWMLKNLGVTPELSERVPGHRTPSQFTFELETQRGLYDVGHVTARMWLEPAAVELKHDDAGRVIDFGRAHVAVRGSVTAHGRSGSPAGEQLARDAVTAYTREITRRYDDYARALPDLHRLREAAKILALVRWAHTRRVALVPPGPIASPAPLPARFQRGFWTANFFANSQKTFFGLVAVGGVDFGPKVGTGWVQPTTDPALGTTALRQLVASSALGQAAVKAAVDDGDLDAARLLAEQSAQAMTGALDFTGHPALGPIPEVPPPTPVSEIELQTAALSLARQNLADFGRAQQALRQSGTDAQRSEWETQRAAAEERLRKLQTLLTPGTRAPEQARHFVKLLRNGDWASLPNPAPRPSGIAAAPSPQPKPAPEPSPIVDPEERARLRGEITQLRSELCRIQTQLRRFNATIQSDQDQRAEWEKVTNDAYESALKRAQEKFEEFSVDFPSDILKEKLATVTDPAERAKIERALRLVDRFKDAYTTRDFSDWAAKEEFTREEIIEGIKQLVSICAIDERLKNYLGKKWGLKRAIAFYEAGDELLTSAYDVTAEVVAWRRLKQLNQNSDSFLQATEASGRRLRAVIAAIHEREVRLGLDPGSTKEPCPAAP
jgi:hypothetical protein